MQTQNYLPSPSHNNSQSLRHLSSGIWLEDRSIPIPWGAKLPHLLQNTYPDHHFQAPSWTEVEWHKVSILNGIQAQRLQTFIYPDGWVDSIFAWLSSSYSMPEVWRAFDHAHDALAHRMAALDAPKLRVEESDCPLVIRQLRCEWQGITLSLVLSKGERQEPFASACLLHISRRSLD